MSVKNSSQTRFILGETDLPKFWYNVNADSPVPPAPVLHPGTMQPVTPDFLSVLFPMDLILQEISTERYHRDPGRSARDLQALPAHPADARPTAGKGAGYPCAYLLQE